MIQHQPESKNGWYGLFFPLANSEHCKLLLIQVIYLLWNSLYEFYFQLYEFFVLTSYIIQINIFHLDFNQIKIIYKLGLFPIHQVTTLLNMALIQWYKYCILLSCPLGERLVIIGSQSMQAQIFMETLKVTLIFLITFLIPQSSIKLSILSLILK